VSYTKDFLESKSQQYPEILKMTDEEALRYLDFMGELVESVNDEMTDIDEGYNVGGRVGFDMGGMSYKDVEERYAEGLTDEEYIRFIKLTPEQRKEEMTRAGVLIDDLAKGGRVGFAGGGGDQDGPTGPGGISPGPGGPGGGMVAGASPDGKGGATGGTSEGFGPSNSGGNTGGNNDGGDKDKDKKGFVDTVRDFVTNPNNVVKGLVSLGFGVPGTVAMGLVSAAEALGLDVGPAADTGPDRGGRADERRIAEAQNIVDTELPLEMMFGGDTLKQQTYQRYIDAGYPEDQARLIADSLMTNFTA